MFMSHRQCAPWFSASEILDLVTLLTLSRKTENENSIRQKPERVFKLNLEFQNCNLPKSAVRLQVQLVEIRIGKFAENAQSLRSNLSTLGFTKCGPKKQFCASSRQRMFSTGKKTYKRFFQDDLPSFIGPTAGVRHVSQLEFKTRTVLMFLIQRILQAVHVVFSNRRRLSNRF